MSIHARFTPQARALFAERIKEMDESTGWGRLPSLNVAMHPSRVSFSDDLSDVRYYNDCYIESRVSEGGAASVLYMFGMWHNMLLGALLVMWVVERSFIWTLFIPYLLFGVGFCLNFIRIFTRDPGISFVRFNRQAQLVHIFWGGPKGKTEEMLHLPWREAVPFTEFVGASMAGGNLLNFAFPTPHGVDDRNEAIKVKGAMSFGDGNFSSNLDRLEFLRRYMAHGLKAVQPSPEAIAAGTVRPPSGYTEQPMPNLSAFGRFWFQFWRYVIDKPMYYAGGGPLIDRRMKRAADRYRWPEEVERLCAEGADLTGIDTTPVAAHDNLFYRYGGMGNPIQYVDAQDRELH